MRYILFFLWTIIFYSIFLLLNHLRRSTQPHLYFIFLAAIFTLMFKSRLPFLKKYSFPEIYNNFEKLRSRLLDSTVARKKCSICGMSEGPKIIIETGINKNLDAKSRKTYCRSHGLQLLEEFLKKFNGKIFLDEPEPKQLSGWFFYRPEDLKVHNYSEDDKKVLDRLIEGYKEKVRQGEVLWLNKEIIGSCIEEPLFKKLSEPEIITIEEAVTRLRKTLDQSHAKFKKWEFWFT